MSMNVSINILFLAHPKHNMRQLLGRKKFQAIFSLATYRPVVLFEHILVTSFHQVIFLSVNDCEICIKSAPQDQKKC